MRFEVEFGQSDQRIAVQMRADDQRFDAAFSAYQEATVVQDVEPYAGAYTVTPAVTEQTLPTAQKLMTQDMTIRSIPYFETSNDKMGKTVYIGTEVEIYGD